MNNTKLSEACCNKDGTQAVFPDLVNPGNRAGERMLEAKPLTFFLKALQLFEMG